jgi:UDP-glucuronate 4-epimerase
MMGGIGVGKQSQSKRILVTGCAGFIGFYVSAKLMSQGDTIIGVDNFNSYYDVGLKNARLDILLSYPTFELRKEDIANKDIVDTIFRFTKPEIVIHLAAQAGVRYSIDHPDEYIKSNILGFYNILEACRHYKIQHLVYASSSSVYGSNTKVPFEETDFVNHPVSLYAATKKSDELLAETYSHLYKIPTTGLRFFTVYGPYGRPDMAYFSFVNNYFEGKPITIYNNGDPEHDLMRDFTYIDDIVEGVVRIAEHPPMGDRCHEIYNIGNNSPVKLMEFIRILESCLSTSLHRPVQFMKKYEPIQPGDVPITYASTDKLNAAIGFKPATPLEVGLQAFTDWYVEYYHKS